MSQWNLSVQLTGQGTDLVNTLRRSSTQARALSRDIADARREITRLRQSSRGDIRIGVRIDARSLRRDVEAAARGAGGQRITIPLGVDGTRLRSEVNRALRTAGGQDLTIDLHVDSSQLRSDVAEAVREASAGHRIEIPIGLADAMQLRRDVAAAVRWASMGHELTIPVNLDIRRATTQLGQLTASLNSSSSASGGLRGNILGLASLATALIPITASVAPLAATLTGAGAATTAFGIALAGQVGALSDAADAQTKYDKAVRGHGATSKEAATAQQALQAQVAAMPAPTREASAALASLKSQYQDWSDALAGDTMPVAVHGFQTLSAVIPRLTPMVQAAAGQMDRLVTITAGGIASDSFDHLFGSFEHFADSSLAKVTDGIVHLMRVLSGQAPAGNSALQEFMDYARSVGPQVAETLKGLGEALLHIMTAASQMGVSVLTLVNVLGKLIAAVPSGALSAFLQLALALKAVQLATRGLAAGGAIVAAFAGQLTAARTAAAGASGVLASAAAAFAGLSRAAKAAVIGSAIGVLIVALSELSRIGRQAPPDVDKLTTSLREFIKTGKVAGEVARVFGTNLGDLSDALRVLTRPNIDQSIKKWLGELTGIDPTAISDAKETIDGLDKSLAGLVKSGHADLARAAFEKLSKNLHGLTPKELQGQLDDYQSALKDQAFEAELAAQSMGLFGQQAQATSAKLDAQKASADGLRQAIQALNDVNRAGLGGMIGFEAAIDAAAAAARQNADALTMTGGQLNLSSEKARNAATALNDLAAKTDAAAASARESGSSWETVNGIYARGRAELIANAQTMGLNKSQAEALASSILKIPSGHTTKIEMQRADALAGLEAVQAKLKATPTAHSVTVHALTATATRMLEELGFKVTHMKDGTARVTVPTGGPSTAVDRIQRMISGIQSKTVTVTTVGVVKGTFPASRGRMGRTLATGGPVRPVPGYADGGDIQTYPMGGYVQGPGTGTSDSILGLFSAGPAMISNTEYVVRAAAVKKYGLGLLDAINTGALPKFASGGSLEGMPRYATGGGMDFSYSGTGSAILSLSDLISTSNDKNGKFSLTTFGKKLAASNNQLDAWRKNLRTVASRAGQDVADALASMGSDGIELTKKMATGSSRYINAMAGDLRNLANAAKANLSEYSSQMKLAVKNQSMFQSDLAKLAAQGYGDLAGRLAAQNDQDAAALAHQAASSKGAAAAANATAKAANGALSSEELAELVQIIAAVKTSKTGLHDVASATGLGEDDIVTVAGKASSQIKSSLGSRSAKFLADLARAQRGLSYANGGIRPGIYGTRAGAVTFAEPSTGGEAYIPLGGNKRASATNVLSDVAGRFGLGLTDAHAGRVVVISQEGPTTVNVPVTKTNASAYDIAHQVGRQMRRARRGGVAARAGS